MNAKPLLIAGSVSLLSVAAFAAGMESPEVAERLGSSPQITSTIPATNTPKATSAPTPKPTESSKATTSNCDSNYSPCIPKVSYDLDCGDIGKFVYVIGVDVHGFDRDGDGEGCESYK